MFYVNHHYNDDLKIFEFNYEIDHDGYYISAIINGNCILIKNIKIQCGTILGSSDYPNYTTTDLSYRTISFYTTFTNIPSFFINSKRNNPYVSFDTGNTSADLDYLSFYQLTTSGFILRKAGENPYEETEQVSFLAIGI